MSRLYGMVTSPPDRENDVFEIWSGDTQVAEIAREPGREIEIALYTHGDTLPAVDLVQFERMLKQGRDALSKEQEPAR